MHETRGFSDPEISVQDTFAHFCALTCSFFFKGQDKEAQTYCPDTKFMSKGYYIGFCLCVPLERGSSDLSCLWGDVQTTCPRCVGEDVGSLFPGSTVLLASSAAGPCAATPPYAPNRPAHGMSGVKTRQILAHALHEKILQRQKGVRPLVSSHAQRALFVSRMNRGSTTDGFPGHALHEKGVQ